MKPWTVERSMSLYLWSKVSTNKEEPLTFFFFSFAIFYCYCYCYCSCLSLCLVHPSLNSLPYSLKPFSTINSSLMQVQSGKWAQTSWFETMSKVDSTICDIVGHINSKGLWFGDDPLKFSLPLLLLQLSLISIFTHSLHALLKPFGLPSIVSQIVVSSLSSC